MGICIVGEGGGGGGKVFHIHTFQFTVDVFSNYVENDC